jgi:hypothetical protein
VGGRGGDQAHVVVAEAARLGRVDDQHAGHAAVASDGRGHRGADLERLAPPPRDERGARVLGNDRPGRLKRGLG